jgi:hypothetical protein
MLSCYHPDRFGVIRFAKQASSARETIMRDCFLGAITVGVVVAAAAISVSIDPAAAQALSVSAAASAPAAAHADRAEAGPRHRLRRRDTGG